MRDKSAKRKRILKAAAALFIEHGFDGTTFIKVSEKSRAAAGSITHFFGDKGELAARVYDDVVSELAADARAALRGHGNNVDAAIRALLSACLSWNEKFPDHRRLMNMLEIYALTSDPSRTDRPQDDLPRVLDEWAHPLAHRKIIAPLSPSQLYAVILAPAMCGARPAAVGPTTDIHASSIDWLTVLTNVTFPRESGHGVATYAAAASCSIWIGER